MKTHTLTPESISGPSSEPITLSEAKKQLEISESDDAHDEQLRTAIQEAREQWESDTDSITCYQTLRIKTDRIACQSQEFPGTIGYFAYSLEGLVLPKRPIVSITSIKYYDVGNTLTTLPTSIYNLDTARGRLQLQYLQNWPSTVSRWDAWEITYQSGFSQDGTLVPAIAKRAMLLLVGHYFENRDMLVSPGMADMKAYENLIKKFMRSTYP